MRAQPAWLVTGASGFLGANAGAWLRGSAYRIGVSRTAPPPGLFDEWHRGDLAEASALVERLRPSVVMNAAAVSSHEACEADPGLAFSVNGTGAGALAASVAIAGGALIHVSTDAVFAGDRGGYREADAVAPWSTYGESKLAGESAVLDALPTALVVRTNFFGWSPSGSRSILEFFVGNLRAGHGVRGYSDFVVTSIYVRDLLQACSRLVEQRAAGVLHVASGDARSKLDFGREVARAFSLDPALITPASANSGGHAASRSRDLSLDTSLAASLVGPLPTQASGISSARADEASVTSELRR